MLVFSLNTVLGFACSLGIDMGYNSKHHREEEEMDVHIHANGSKHHHKKKSDTHSHQDTHSHKKEKDNCCNDSVLKLSQAEKMVTQPTKSANPVFFTSFVTVYYNIGIPFFTQTNSVDKYYISGHHPPIPDIRIDIQSFQI